MAMSAVSKAIMRVNFIAKGVFECARNAKGCVKDGTGG
jgi:hypothetical protein